MIKIKLENFIIIIGFLIWFIETAYFGFNLHAESEAEKILDHISLFLIINGFIFKFLNANKSEVGVKVKIVIDEEFFKRIEKEINKGDENNKSESLND